MVTATRTSFFLFPYRVSAGPESRFAEKLRVTHLTLDQAEDLLDWLEAHGLSGQLDFNEDGCSIEFDPGAV
jgi:hypothetical protein